MQEIFLSLHNSDQLINITGDCPLANNKRKSKSQVIDFAGAKDEAIRNKKQSQVQLIPKNLAQEDYVDMLCDDSIKITLAVGPAGTGKTLLAVLRAVQAYKRGECDRIVITRPAVSVDEQHGFLPGDINKKMEPWMRPIYDIFEEYWSVADIQMMIEDRIIEVSPLAFMRGRTFKNCYIVADEMQNSTVEQMKMLLTRIGSNTKLSVTGDLKQHDRSYSLNGLKDFTERLTTCRHTGIAVCKFERCHVERDPIVEEVLNIYGEE